MQKMRIAFRGWSRRREEEAKRKEKEFLQRNVTWAAPAAPAQVAPQRSSKVALDLEGLQVAYLDDSGKIAHYLDLETGEVIEFGSGEHRDDIVQKPARYKKVPTRTDVSDDADRRAFAASLDAGPVRERLARSPDAADFRRQLAADRGIERAWYNFKNERATQAIAKWLKEIGV